MVWDYSTFSSFSCFLNALILASLFKIIILKFYSKIDAETSISLDTRFLAFKDLALFTHFSFFNFFSIFLMVSCSFLTFTIFYNSQWESVYHVYLCNWIISTSFIWSKSTWNIIYFNSGLWHYETSLELLYAWMSYSCIYFIYPWF